MKKSQWGSPTQKGVYFSLMKSQWLYHFGVVSLIFLLCATGTTHAARRDAGDRFEMKINISGSIVVTGKCTFNEGGEVLVDFGDIRFSSTSNELGKTYIEPLISDMTCTGDTSGTARMMLSSKDGSEQLYDGNKLLEVGIGGGVAANTGLGIALRVNGQIQDVNVPFAVEVMHFPKLEVQLIQTDVNKKLISGNSITSSATLLMEFD
ncbi:fimbrial protein [Citrobacter braakii]